MIAIVTVLTARAVPARAQHLVPSAAGIWQSRTAFYGLSAAAEKRLLSSLTRITGIERLAFAADGRLELGADPGGQKGSVTARRILRDALALGDVLVLEDYSNSEKVNFGQIERMEYANDATNQHASVWWIRLDFADFQRIDASPRVRASFDEGFTLLHELLHALGHHDATNVSELGACETTLNQVREELGLPLRAEYFATPIRVLTADVVAIRLRFLDGRNGDKPPREQDLQFAFSTLASSASTAALHRTPD
jgi:hypothetical protein